MSKYPDDANGDVFRRLEESNFDFSKDHSVEFFAVFATEVEADKIARMYVEDHENNFTLKNIETRPYDKGGMVLELVALMKVTYDNIVNFENKFQKRVTTVEGYLDGWGIWQG